MFDKRPDKLLTPILFERDNSMVSVSFVCVLSKEDEVTLTKLISDFLKKGESNENTT